MVRPATEEDMPRILSIYAGARAFMRARGNPGQWGETKPDPAQLLRDIRRGELFLIADEAGEIHGCFALIGGEDPTYARIDGAWKDPSPYATLHRVAGDGTGGVFAACVAFARGRYRHLRVDTHRDNGPMRRVIGENGFTYCGIIYLADGSPRLAYEWTEV